MPDITLHGREFLERNALPAVCVKCDATAVTAKSVPIDSHFMLKIILVFLFNFLGLFLAYLITTGLSLRRTVRLPVCKSHDNDWNINIAVMLMGWILAIICLSIGFNLPNGHAGQKVFTILALVVFAVGAFAGVVLTLAKTRAVEIDQSKIRLVNASSLFVESLRHQRAEDAKQTEGDA